jgi:hypothetical protein
MAESNFGIMELLQKLFKERGTGVSDKEMGIMGKTTGKGYESFIDKNTGEFKRTDTTYQAGDKQTIDPLENTLPYSNATTPALSKMRGLVPGTGAVSNYELDQFKIASQYVDDGALSGWLTNQLPALTRMGVGNIDLQVPPREIRNQINAMTAQPLGAVSGREYNFMVDNMPQAYNFNRGAVSDREYEFTVDGQTEGYSFDSQPTEQAIQRMRDAQGITANFGAVSDAEMEAKRRSMLADVGMQSFGNPSDLDVNFAQALSGLSSREQMEIISATQGYNDAQVENFKRQYLQGRVSPYELEQQRNLGF